MRGTWRLILISCAVFAQAFAATAQDNWVEDALALSQSLDTLPTVATQSDWQGFETEKASLPIQDRLEHLDSIAFQYVTHFKFHDYRRVAAELETLAQETDATHLLASLRIYDTLVQLDESGDYAAAQTQLEQIANAVDLQAAQRIRAKLVLGYILVDAGRLSSALETLNDARSLSRTIDMPATLAFDLDYAASYTLAYVGDYKGAIRALVRALELGAEIGRPDDQITVLHSLTIMLLETGYLDDARALNARALTLADQAQDPLHVLHANNYCGEVHLALGQFAKAADCFLEMDDHIHRLNERRIPWLLDTSTALARSGQTKLARHYLDRLHSDPNFDLSDAQLRVDAHHIEAELLHAEGHTDAAFLKLSGLIDEELELAERSHRETTTQLRQLALDEAAHLRELQALGRSVITRQRTIGVLILVLAIGGLMASVLLWRNHSRLRQSARENVALLGEAKALTKDLREKSAKAEWLANRDPLTGLLNRRGFFAALEQHFDAEMSDCNDIAIGVLDLDGFKSVNDIFGHQIGDGLLLEVSDRLRTVLGPDAVIARLGGDEFTILLPHILSSKCLATLGLKVCDAVGQAAIVSDACLRPRASLGFALHPGSARSPDELYNQADYALYRAKSENLGGFRLFDRDMNVEFERVTAIERALGDAKAEDLFIEYQPIVDVQAGQPVGFEALVRWCDPSLGNVPPAEFIPIAERCGAMSRLSRIILARALEEAADWDPALRLSVNLSATDIGSLEAVHRLKSIILQSGFDPGRLILEITETGIIRDAELAKRALDILKSTGVAIALDDFGSGYSTLVHLQEFPIDRLKIDMALSRKIVTDDTTRNIVEFIVSLCERLEIDCVIEGVANQKQVAFLEQASGALGQGYYFARPMRPHKIDAYLASRSSARPPRPTIEYLNLIDKGAAEA